MTGNIHYKYLCIWIGISPLVSPSEKNYPSVLIYLFKAITHSKNP